MEPASIPSGRSLVLSRRLAAGDDRSTAAGNPSRSCRPAEANGAEDLTDRTALRWASSSTLPGATRTFVTKQSHFYQKLVRPSLECRE